MRFRLLTIGLLMNTAMAFAQQPVSPETIEEDLIDEILSEAAEEYDYSDISSRLQYFLKHPIDLNQADEGQLSELFFLSPLQISALLEHRNTTGDFVSLYELQAISGFDEGTIRRLLPFTTIEGNGTIVPVLKEGKHDLMLRYGRIIERQEGYIAQEDGATRYQGGPERLLLRYRYRVDKRFMLSLNAEKDPGEPFFREENRKGFDFYSGALYATDLGRVRRLVVGDYSLQTGQGLTLWNGLSFGKGSLVQNVARQGMGVRPYTSTNESQFLRGVAATFAFGNLDISPFVSYKRADASLSNDSLTFSNFQESGYHRTATEIRNRNSVLQQVYGLDLSFKTSGFLLGATGISTRFDKMMVPNTQLYNRFRFEGDQVNNASLHYSYTVRNVYAFGEAAHNFEGGSAFLNGLIATLSHRLSLVVLHRHYQKNFFSLWGQGFAESSETINERGLYSGLIWNPTRRFEWVAFADHFRFPWLKYRVDGPSSGVDLFSQVSVNPSRSQRYILRFRYRSKSENENVSSAVNPLAEVRRLQVRGQAQYHLNRVIEFRNRLEFSKYQKGSAEADFGYMLSHDVIYLPEQGTLSGNLRLAYFMTDSYNSRVYAFENDVLYGSSSSAYHGRGIRFYTNVRWRMQRNVDIWLRYAAFYKGANGLGSGLDFIEGNVKSDIKLQIRLQF